MRQQGGLRFASGSRGELYVGTIVAGYLVLKGCDPLHLDPGRELLDVAETMSSPVSIRNTL